MTETSKFFLMVSVLTLGWIYYNFWSIADRNFNGSYAHRLDELSQAYVYVSVFGAIWGFVHVACSPRRKLQRLILCAIILFIPVAAHSSFSYIENNYGGLGAE